MEGAACPEVASTEHSKVKSKVWQRTLKFGIRIPKSIKEALRIDAENGNTLWWGAIDLEMSNV
jgi:hypothetical protein